MPELLADLPQPVRVRAVPGANDQNYVDQRSQLSHGGLAVLRGVANVAGLGTNDVLEPLLDGFDGGAGIVHAQRGLGDVGHRSIVGNIEALHVLGALDQMDLALQLAHSALDLGMPGVADEDHDAALVEISLTLMVDLGDERADGI